MRIRDLFTNRRSGDDRRQNKGAAAEPERRADERRQGERRNLVYSVRYTTHSALGPVENWLDVHCQGEWRIVLDGVTEDLASKIVLIMFERDDERQRFITAFKKR